MPAYGVVILPGMIGGSLQMSIGKTAKNRTRVRPKFLVPIAAVIGLSMLAPVSARAEGAWETPAELDKLCAGWNGKWRAEIDKEFAPAKGWGASSEPPDWSVEQTAPGRCLFRFGGKTQFALDTTSGYYDITPYENDKQGPVQRGKLLQAELADAKAWNVVVDAPARTGSYRMQMTMAGDLFTIYTSTSNRNGPRQPASITVHRRQ